MSKITPDVLAQLLPAACSRSTSSDPDGWSEINPLWGHCAVVALLVNDIWGGQILRASLTDIPDFAQMRSHYWNRLPDGTEIDLSRSQFGDKYPNLFGEIRSSGYLLDNQATLARYIELAKLVRIAVLKNGYHL